MEGLAILGAIGYVAYWILSGKAAAFLGPGLTSLFPTQTTMLNLPPNTEQQYGNQVFGANANGTAYTVQQSGGVVGTGTITVMTDAGPQDFGPSGEVPGTGQTVNELRSIGYTNQQISLLIETYYANPGAYSGASSFDSPDPSTVAWAEGL
jgi:hypothetical protein